MTTLTTNDLNWISLGFRLGQLTDTCNPEFRDADGDDQELIGSLIAGFALAASSSIESRDHQSLVRATINELGES